MNALFFPDPQRDGGRAIEDTLLPSFQVHANNPNLAQLSQLALWNGDFWGVPGQNCESKQGGVVANPL
jgi:hypothetical protein